MNSYSPLGFLKYIFMKLRGRRVYLRGSCSQCGTCCTSINIEGPKGWLRNELEFLRIIEKHPEYYRFSVTGRDNLGYLLFRCNKLTAQNKCSCYEERLPICKNFPDKNLIFMGGGLPENCRYKMVIAPSFKKILAKEILK